MKNTKKIVLLIAALSIGTASQAQLGGMLKKAAKNVATDKVNSAVSGSASGTAGSGSAGGTLNWTEYTQTPAITMKSLLDHTEVFDVGILRPNFYTATFIPNKDKKGERMDFYSNKRLLSIKTYINDKFISENFFTQGQRYEGDKQITYVDNTNQQDVDAKQEGKYRLDFYADGTMFYTFDFEVYKKANTDPYATANTMWFSRGPWDKYAYMQNQKGNLIFGFYMSHDEFKPNPNDAKSTSKTVNWYPELYKDGKLISQPKLKNTGTVKQAEWDDFTTAFKGAKDYIKYGDLVDGEYAVKVTVDGEKAPRTYNFSVKGKQIVQIPQQDRAVNTNPKTLIEGWNDFFWMERK